LAGKHAPQEGVDAGEEFGEGKGFAEVVVGPGLQAGDAVFDGVVRGEDEDAEVCAFGTELAEDVEAVALGKREVEEQEFGALGVDEEEALFCGAGSEYVMAGGAEAGGEGLGHLPVVFDDEDAGGDGGHAGRL